MKKTLLFISILSCIAQYVWGVKASPYPLRVRTYQGTDTTVYLKGDEHFHWVEDKYGQWMRQDSATLQWRPVQALTHEQIVQRAMRSPLREPQQSQSAIHINLAPRGLVILVNFSDTTFKTSKAQMDSMLNGINYQRTYVLSYGNIRKNISCSGSARQYFIDQSMGQYTPQFDVVGPVTVSREHSFYGKNNSYWGTQDDNAYLMIKEACQQADKKWNIDFTQYDNDNDGFIDFVYVIYAGYGEADSGIENTIWPHSSYWTQWGHLQLDGKLLNRYACSNEIDYTTQNYAGIGTFCHEFSHVLGLPDLYDTDYNDQWKTLGQWDIMDAGSYNNYSNTPSGYSGYERFFLGWATPRILNDTVTVTLNELQSSNEVLLVSSTGKHNLIGNDPNPTTFFLLENRQKKGWDLYLPGAGMMLTKIKYSYGKWSDNSVNASSAQGVDLIEADDNDELTDISYYGRKKDVFPAGAKQHNIVFPFQTFSINNIRSWNQVITFHFKDTPIETDLKDIHLDTNEYVLGVYDMMGHFISGTLEKTLPHGMYLVKTSLRTYKICQ